MSELTLESLARRLEEVERRLNEKQRSILAPTKDWRRIVGISKDNEFTRFMFTANRRDFKKVPGLRFENWLE